MTKKLPNILNAERFAEKYGGEIVGKIEGKWSQIGSIIELKNRMVHIFLANKSFRKYRGISMREGHLDHALEDEALIIQTFEGEDLALHSKLWDYYSRKHQLYFTHPDGSKQITAKWSYFDEFKIADFEKYFPQIKN